jgi:hypothetical protein
MERGGEIIKRFIVENRIPKTANHDKEILALMFNVFRLGFLFSKFSTRDKQLAVRNLLTITFMNGVTDLDMDVDPDFLASRAHLYDQAVDDYQNSDFGIPLLAQFIAFCEIDGKTVVDDFNDVAAVISELIRTATLRNNDFIKDYRLIES